MLETPILERTGANSYHASYGTDRNLYIEFYMEAEHQEFLSEQEGHPVYKDTAYISIMTPGSKNTVRRRVKMEDDKFGPSDPHRFPQQWAQFMAQQEQTPEGMPLTEWPVVTKAQALNLKAAKIYTVEQLALIPDQLLGPLGLGGRELRERAKAYLERAVDASSVTKLMARIDALEADNKVLQEKLLTASDNPASSSEKADRENKQLKLPKKD